MQETTTEFETKVNDDMRVPQFYFGVDWNLVGTYQDESDYVLVIEIERVLNEPLGGVNLSQANIRLDNTDNRYTPSD